MEKEESIDLQELLKIIKLHKKRLFMIIASCTIFAMITAFFILPKTYESTALVQAKTNSNQNLSLAANAMAMMGIGGSVSSPTMAYIEMMKSRSVIEPIIEKLDIDPEDKEKMTVKDFTKKYLDLKNTKGTDLIEITSTGKSPEEAQMITTEVTNGFLGLMTNLNQNQQSFMLKFLNERLSLTKNEMEVAEKNFEEYRQTHKIFAPTEQGQAILEGLAAVDKRIGELKVNNDSASAHLQEVNQQLEKQNVSLREYNITDNESIQKIKDSIITKEIQLLELEQRYTEKHPDVITLKKEIDEMQLKLGNEISNSIASGTNTLNPIHAGLLADKVKTETEIAVNQATLSAILNLQNKGEAEISKLSAEQMEYIKLQREVEIARSVYNVLVQNQENAKIQQAMESMDIQIIDAADLPKKPAGPRKLLISVMGGVIGVMIAFGYIFLMYNRKKYI